MSYKAGFHIQNKSHPNIRIYSSTDFFILA